MASSVAHKITYLCSWSREELPPNQEKFEDFGPPDWIGMGVKGIVQRCIYKRPLISEEDDLEQVHAKLKDPYEDFEYCPDVNVYTAPKLYGTGFYLLPEIEKAIRIWEEKIGKTSSSAKWLEQLRHYRQVIEEKMALANNLFVTAGFPHVRIQEISTYPED
ncbi:MAG TPA: hypothetical protein VLE89_03210 [Chlamydiales bacterium]|nr:hypothetical protein [Chlamydiales bacterium]